MTDFVAENKERFPVGALVCIQRLRDVPTTAYKVVRHTPKRIVIVPNFRTEESDTRPYERHFNASGRVPKEVGERWNELVPYTPEIEALEAIRRAEIRMWNGVYETRNNYEPTVEAVEEYANRLLALARCVRETRQALEDYQNSKKEEK